MGTRLNQKYLFRRAERSGSLRHLAPALAPRARTASPRWALTPCATMPGPLFALGRLRREIAPLAGFKCALLDGVLGAFALVSARVCRCALAWRQCRSQ